MPDPAWLEIARRNLGEREMPGPVDNPAILRFYADVGHGWVRHDETAWCAAFVGSCLERAGWRSTRSLRARSYLAWGEAMEAPRPGCVVVLSHGRDPALGHVGFFVREQAGTIDVLGGNQGDAVSIAAFAKSRAMGYRWPRESNAQPDSERDDLFDSALRHVLAMEGGWSNDPADPGGPTNQGITLADYAAYRGVRLGIWNRTRLVEDLRHIEPDVVSTIYRERYWIAACCNRLPEAIAFLHFDAAVNQGVGTAARLLQQALGVGVDGEIGPITLGAAAGAPLPGMLRRYAALRRSLYRQLRTFARFGRGWLRRVDATLSAAEALVPAGASGSQTQSTVQPKEPDPMPNPTPTSNPKTATPATPAGSGGTAAPAPTKWWGRSMTIWGAIVSALALIAPALGPALGFDLTPDMVREIGGQIGAVVQILVGLAGTLMTIYGRARAVHALEQAQVSFRL